MQASTDRLGALSGAERELFEYAARGQLLLRHCRKCGQHGTAARYICAGCGSQQLEPMSASGIGTVHAFTVVHRSPLEQLRDRVPYVVALVDLAEGVRVLGNIWHDQADIHVGARVEVEFEAVAEGLALPQFRLVTADSPIQP